MHGLDNWTSRERPPKTPMFGQYVDVVPWSADDHAQGLWQAFGRDAANDLLFHFGWPRLESAADLAAILNGYNESGQFITCIFADKENAAPLGMANYMSIVEAHGRIETGAIAHGPALQKTRAATEAHFLMACRVFDELGYRRYE